MSENTEENTEASNDSESIDLEELDSEQKEAILNNPDVKKSLRYQHDSVESVQDGLSSLTNKSTRSDEMAEAYDLLVSGIAERSGRVTESTVDKVLTGFVDEVDEVSH